ncbi:MAG: hypothetical protein H0U49_02820 [Parachlamydiaceae bacterium]|nr:hypothetical protein [Parachlamydiaceae bacterium]
MFYSSIDFTRIPSNRRPQKQNREGVDAISILFLTDGVFSIGGEQLLFHEAILTPDDVKEAQDVIRDPKIFRQMWLV